MNQTTERTSWVLRVPYHASADQVLGHTDSADAQVYDLDVLAARGNFRSNDVVRFSIENIGEVAIKSVTFKDSPDNITFTTVADNDHNPAYPIVVEGRAAGRLLLNTDVKYLQVLGHNEVVGAQGLIRLTMEKLSSGYPNE